MLAERETWLKSPGITMNALGLVFVDGKTTELMMSLIVLAPVPGNIYVAK